MPYTGVGSLPYTNIDEAISYSFSHTLPFLPELPNISQNEWMIPKSISENLNSFIALNEFIKTAKLKNLSAVKVQLACPFTVYLYGQTSITLEELIQKNLRTWTLLIHELKHNGLLPKIFVDSPSSFQVINRFGFDTFLSYIHHLLPFGPVSIHSCGEISDKIIKLPLEFFSYDSSKYILPKEFKHSKIIPIHGITFEGVTNLGPSDWYSSPCGLALSSKDDCSKYLNLFQKIAG